MNNTVTVVVYILYRIVFRMFDFKFESNSIGGPAFEIRYSYQNSPTQSNNQDLFTKANNIERSPVKTIRASTPKNDKFDRGIFRLLNIMSANFSHQI